MRVLLSNLPFHGFIHKSQSSIGKTARMKMFLRSSLKSRIFIGNSILPRCSSQMKIGASSMMQHTAGSAVMAVSGLAKGW